MALPASASLQELYLDTNELGDEGVAEILAGIGVSCRSLRVLDLNQNELVHAATLLRRNQITGLQKLNLVDNPDLEVDENLQLLRAMYPDVHVDDELDDIGDGGNDDVDALGDMLVLTKLD